MSVMRRAPPAVIHDIFTTLAPPKSRATGKSIKLDDIAWLHCSLAGVIGEDFLIIFIDYF